MNLEEEVKLLREENRYLKEAIKALERRLAELEGLLKDKSQPAFVKEEVRQYHKKTGQKEGHPGVSRTTPAQIDEKKELDTTRCPDCDSSLSDIAEKRTRYVTDIPLMKATTTEYTICRRYCRRCKHVVEPRIEALPHARFGLRLMLLVLILKLDKRMPSKQLTSLLELQYGLKISDGEVYGMLRQLAEAFGSYYATLQEKIKNALVKHSDETSWREDGKNRWLWLFINREAALYLIHEKRSSKVPIAELGDQLDNIVNSDRFSAYSQLAKKTGCLQQLCWAHILRESERLAKLYPEARYIHKRLKHIYFRATSEKPPSVEKLLHWTDLIVDARRYRIPRVYKFARSICWTHRENLFRFVGNPEVESTNNRAERGLRHAVVIRKISNGSRSEQGSEITAKLLSVVQTVKMNDPNPMSFMMNVLQERK